jgi:hypothetical protein
MSTVDDFVAVFAAKPADRVVALFGTVQGVQNEEAKLRVVVAGSGDALVCACSTSLWDEINSSRDIAGRMVLVVVASGGQPVAVCSIAQEG